MINMPNGSPTNTENPPPPLPPRIYGVNMAKLLFKDAALNLGKLML